MGGLVEAQILAAIEAFATGDAGAGRAGDRERRARQRLRGRDRRRLQPHRRQAPAGGERPAPDHGDQQDRHRPRAHRRRGREDRAHGQAHPRARRAPCAALPGDPACGADRGEDAAPGARRVRAPRRGERRRGAQGGLGDRRRVPLGAAPADHLHDGGPAHHLDRAGDRLGGEGDRAHRRPCEEHRRAGDLHRQGHRRAPYLVRRHRARDRRRNSAAACRPRY